MKPDLQRKVLRQVADRFNRQGIRWQVGASMLLYLKGVVDRAGDLDLLVDEQDYTSAHEILMEMGKEEKIAPHPMFRSEHFSTFVVEGVGIDLMAAYTVHFIGGVFTYPFEPHHAEVMDDHGVSIYLAPLEFWWITYRCMGDPKARVPLLRDHFDRHGFNRDLVAIAKDHVKKAPEGSSRS